REKENLETERFNQKIEEYRLLEDGKVITTFFKNDGFIVDDIRNVSGNQYLVYANLSRYEVELKKGKVIYINKLKE
ncbi:hypothetical protein NY18_15810, partial [Listeria monocytogenes]|nr:hypothetical protein [Listeria monocytogenes]